MRILRYPLFFIPFILLVCGVNTDKPVYPLFTLFRPVQTPALLTVKPVELWTIDNQYKIEFEISYYITSQEPEFMGYNLLTSTTSTSAQNSGLGTVLYLPSGIEPSFLHVGAKPSTAASSKITQRVTDYRAAPSPLPFELCEKYFFRLQSVTSNGIHSNTGNEVGSCAILDTTRCPKGTVCNP